jgi:hypothetical protein
MRNRRSGKLLIQQVGAADAAAFTRCQSVRVHRDYNYTPLPGKLAGFIQPVSETPLVMDFSVLPHFDPLLKIPLLLPQCGAFVCCQSCTVGSIECALDPMMLAHSLATPFEPGQLYCKKHYEEMLADPSRNRDTDVWTKFTMEAHPVQWFIYTTTKEFKCHCELSEGVDKFVTAQHCNICPERTDREFRCTNQGCQATSFGLKASTQHAIDCAYQLVPCPHECSDQLIPANELQHHITHQCSVYNFQCSMCSQPVTKESTHISLIDCLFAVGARVSSSASAAGSGATPPANLAPHLQSQSEAVFQIAKKLNGPWVRKSDLQAALQTSQPKKKKLKPTSIEK